MAVSVDTYDEENGIHPRFKQVGNFTDYPPAKWPTNILVFENFAVTVLSIYILILAFRWWVRDLPQLVRFLGFGFFNQDLGVDIPPLYQEIVEI